MPLLAGTEHQSVARGVLSLCAVGVLLVCFGLFHPVALPNHPILEFLLGEFFAILPKLGDTLIIAGLLGVVVDQGIKLKLIKEVVEAASPRLIGRNLPAPVHSALLGYFNINFARPTWDIQYALTPVTGASGAVKVATMMQGSLINYGVVAEKWKFDATLDASPLDPKIGKSTILKVRMSEENGPILFEEPIVDSLAYQREAMLTPLKRYETSVETLEYLPETYFQPLFTSTTVVQATIKAQFPQDKLSVKLEVPSAADPEPVPRQTIFGCEWEVRTPLLPGQCILIYWKPI